MSEHANQNKIRNALAGLLALFRANVGKGWTGNKVFHPTKPMMVAVVPGDVVISQARPFDTGLPAGFSDTFGVLRVTITQEMVGQVIGQAVFGEIKSDTGRTSEKQSAFLAAMKFNGARVGVWRTPADAMKTIFDIGEK